MAVLELQLGRRGSWKPGVDVGVRGGIAQYLPGGTSARTTLTDVVASYGADNSGVSNSGPNIQSAIDAISAGGVAYLPAGNYKLTSGLTIPPSKGSRTLRGPGLGSGVARAVVKLVGNVKFYIGSSSDYQHNWPPSGNTVSAGLTKGSTTVTIGTTAEFSVGQMIRLEFDNQLSTVAIQAGAVPTLSTFGYREVRSQITRVTAKTSTTLTFFPGIYHAPDPALTAKVKVFQTQMEGFGIEGIEFDYSECTQPIPIEFGQSVNCWMYQVKSTATVNYHAYFTDCLNIETRWCWFDGRQGSGSNGAALLLGSTSGALAEHCVIARVFPCVEINAGSCGNALLHNVIERKVGDGGGICNMNHGPHNSHNLYEGNVVTNLQSDGYFGGASEDTISRNWIHGSLIGNATLSHKVILNRFTRNYSIIGNVIGIDGVTQGEYSFGEPFLGGGASSGTAKPSAGDFWADFGATATLTARASDTEGTLTLNSGVYKTGQLVSIWWNSGAGNRSKCLAGAVVGNVVEFDAGSGDNLPILGTTLECWMGPDGYPEFDEDVEATVDKRGNYHAAAVGTGAIPSDELLGADTLPDSFANTSGTPANWPAGYDYPPFDPTNPAASQDYERIPSGTWFITGEIPGETLPEPAASTTTIRRRSASFFGFNQL